MSRIGPEIHHNKLVNNSLNGLFVRVGTEAGSTCPEAERLRTLERDGHRPCDEREPDHRFAARRGLRSEHPAAGALVIQTAVNDGSTTGGSLGSVGTDTKYTYKLTYVDRFGFESPASTAMTKTITAGQRGRQVAVDAVHPIAGRAGIAMWRGGCTAARTTGRSCSWPN